MLISDKSFFLFVFNMSTAEEKALAEQLVAEETEKIDIVAKEWIQAESEKEVVK